MATDPRDIFGEYDPPYKFNDNPTEEQKEVSQKIMEKYEKIAVYETQIEDMLHALQDRLDEFKGSKKLTAFEEGRQTAYLEMMDIIKTRHKMIMEVLSDE